MKEKLPLSPPEPTKCRIWRVRIPKVEFERLFQTVPQPEQPLRKACKKGGKHSSGSDEEASRRVQHDFATMNTHLRSFIDRIVVDPDNRTFDVQNLDGSSWAYKELGHEVEISTEDPPERHFTQSMLALAGCLLGWAEDTNPAKTTA